MDALTQPEVTTARAMATSCWLPTRELAFQRNRDAVLWNHPCMQKSDVQVILPGQWIILLEPDVIYNVEEVSGWRGRTRDTAWPGINGMGRNRLAFKHRS